MEFRLSALALSLNLVFVGFMFFVVPVCSFSLLHDVFLHEYALASWTIWETSEWFLITGEGTVTENVFGSMPVHASGTRVHEFPWYTAKSGNGCRISTFSPFHDSAKSLSKVLVPLTHPQQNMRIPVAPHSCQYLNYQSFKF